MLPYFWYFQILYLKIMTTIDTSIAPSFVDQEFELMKKFSEYYPGAEIEKMDPVILAEMMYAMLELEVEKDPTLVEKETVKKSPVVVKDKDWNKDIVKENADLAEALIPEMAFTQSLIHLHGKINEVPVVFMVDTGASMCVTHEYVVEKCCLQHLVDTKEIKYVTGAHSTEPTLGKIHCVEIQLNVESDDGSTSYVPIPVSIDVTHDIVETKSITSDKMKNMLSAMKNILETHPRVGEEKEDLGEQHKDEHAHCGMRHDVILGQTFLRSYRAIIDFGARCIVLNGHIKIPFK